MDKNGFLIQLSESDATAFGRVDFADQTFPQKVFSAIWSVESEVNNGGFSQYFMNSSSETAGFVVEALEAIKAPRTADICRKAIAAAFPDGMPGEPDAISAAAADFTDEIEESLNSLDQEFYQYPHNLTDLLFAFVATHPEEFGPVPE